MEWSNIQWTCYGSIMKKMFLKCLDTAPGSTNINYQLDYYRYPRKKERKKDKKKKMKVGRREWKEVEKLISVFHYISLLELHFQSHFLLFSEKSKGATMHFNGPLLKKRKSSLEYDLLAQILGVQTHTSKHSWAGIKLEILWPLEQSGHMLVLINPCLPLRSYKSSHAKEERDLKKITTFVHLNFSTFSINLSSYNVTLKSNSLRKNSLYEWEINTGKSKSWPFLNWNAFSTRNGFVHNFFSSALLF